MHPHCCCCWSTIIQPWFFGLWSDLVCLIKSDSHDQPSVFLFASAHGFPSLPDCSFVLLFTPFLACYMHPCFYFYFLISYLIVPFIQISSKFIYLCVMSILCLMLNNIKIQKKYTMSFYLSFFLICQKIQKIYYV
jgi:hypothetical protein